MLAPTQQARFALLGFTEADASCLAAMHDELRAPSERFVDGFYDHLRRFDETATLLGDRATVERLKRSMRRYFDELTQGLYDEAYVARRARVGRTHHSVQLSPRWYIASYSRYVSACLPAVVHGPDAAERVRAFLRIVFFDAGLALESYGLLVERDVANADKPTVPPPSATQPSRVTAGELLVRRSFLGVTERDHEVVRLLGGLLPEAELANVVDRVPALPPSARASFERWFDAMLDAARDPENARARIGFGQAQERHGVAPSGYLAAVGSLLAEIAAEVVARAPRPAEALESLCRLAFLDVTLVLDAYLIARVDVLLRAPRFAHALVTRMPSGVVVVDRELRVTFANHSMLELLGTDGAMLLGRDVREALDISGLAEALESVAAGSAPQLEVVSRLTPHPSAAPSSVSRLVRARVMPAPGDGESPPASLTVLIDDVTQVVELGDRVETTEHRLRQLGAEIDGLVWEVARDTGRMTQIGGKGLPALGFTPAEWLGRPNAWTAQMPPRHERRFLDAVSLLDVGVPSVELEHRMIAKHGRTVWLSTRVRQEREGGRVVLRGLSVDVTEAHRLRVALRDRLRAERILSTIAQRALVASSSVDVTLEACKELTRARGVVLVAMGDVDGELLHAWRANPNGPATLPAEWRGILRGCVSGCRFERADGTMPEATFDALGARAVQIVPIEVAELPRGAVLVASRARLDAATSRLVQTVAMLIAQTMRQREIESRDAQRRKLEALGTLAAGVAHDFGNMLAAIQSQAELGQLEGAASPGARDELTAIVDTTKRGGDLVKQILSFTRPQLSGTKAMSLGHNLAEAMERVRRKLPGMDLALDVRTDAKARIDAMPLERMLLVLCKNAAEAMQNKGRVEVVLREVTRAERLPGLEDAALVVELSVRDRGAGIPSELRDRITDPFFTTRATRSGLGLSIAQAIAAAHNAALAFDDATDGGTVVRFQMPAIRPRDAHSGRVLVVDDDVLRLDGIRTELVAKGVETTACSTPDAALTLLPEDGYRLDAIVLRSRDDRLAARWPTARVLLIGNTRSAAISANLSLEETAAEILDALEA